LIKENPCKYAKFPKESNTTSHVASFYNVNQCNELLNKTKGTPLYNMPHIRWHDLRHSTASFLIEKGWHMKDISDWLGHSSIKTTMDIYGHISTERKKELSKDLIGILA